MSEEATHAWLTCKECGNRELVDLRANGIPDLNDFECFLCTIGIKPLDRYVKEN